MKAACNAIVGHGRPWTSAAWANPRREANATINLIGLGSVVVDAGDYYVRRSASEIRDD